MEEEVWGVRGRDIRTSGDLERDVRVGRGPRRLPSLGPKAGGKGATSKEMRVLRRKIGVVLTSRAALHQHLLIMKQDRDKEFSGMVRQQVKGTRQHLSLLSAVIRHLHRAADTHLSGRDAKVLESIPSKGEGHRHESR